MLIACTDKKANQTTDTTISNEEKNEIIEMETLTDELDEATKEIDKTAEELDALLDEIDK